MPRQAVISTSVPTSAIEVVQNSVPHFKNLQPIFAFSFCHGATTKSGNDLPNLWTVICWKLITSVRMCHVTWPKWSTPWYYVLLPVLISQMKWKFMKDTYTYIHTQIFTFTYSYADVKTDNTKKINSRQTAICDSSNQYCVYVITHT